MLEFEYVRSAYKNGLKLEAELGVNPYKFGMVGSTDSHTGLAARGRRQLLRQDDLLLSRVRSVQSIRS